MALKPNHNLLHIIREFSFLAIALCGYFYQTSAFSEELAPKGVVENVESVKNLSDSGPVRHLQYKLRKGKTYRLEKTYPSYTLYWLEIFNKDTEALLRTDLVYITWDFNADEKPDLLEAINKQGETLFSALDLDFDGKPDWMTVSTLAE